jgi:hypothetical protein
MRRSVALYAHVFPALQSTFHPHFRIMAVTAFSLAYVRWDSQDSFNILQRRHGLSEIC